MKILGAVRRVAWLVALAWVLHGAIRGYRIDGVHAVGITVLAGLGVFPRLRVALAAAAGALGWLVAAPHSPTAQAGIASGLLLVAALGFLAWRGRQLPLLATLGVALAAAPVAVLLPQSYVLSASLGFVVAAALVRAAQEEGPRLAGVAAVLVCLAAVAGATVRADRRSPWFPAWRAEVTALDYGGLQPQSPLGDVAGDDLGFAALSRLRVSGARDAAHVLIAAQLAHNADPERIRFLCAGLGRRAVLDERWRSLIDRGERACEVVDSEGAGAAKSVTPHAPALGHASLRRLHSDLAFERGDTRAGVELALAAERAGDPFARRNAVRALLDRNRDAQAAALAAADDAITTLWLSGTSAKGAGGTATPTPATPALRVPPGSAADPWASFNVAVDPSSLVPLRRGGVRRIDAPGELRGVYDAALGQHVTHTDTRYRQRFAIALPLPRQAAVPASVRLHARVRDGFEIDVHGNAGERLIYTCEPFTPQAGETVRELDAALCAGDWTQTELALDVITDGIRRWILRGDFSLAQFEVVP